VTLLWFEEGNAGMFGKVNKKSIPLKRPDWGGGGVWGAKGQVGGGGEGKK